MIRICYASEERHRSGKRMDDERRSRLRMVSFGAATVLPFAALLLTGPLAVAVGALAIAALMTGFALSTPRPGDPEEWPDPSPPAPREPPAREQAIYLTAKADTPPAVRSWLERVERMAESEAGKGRG